MGKDLIISGKSDDIITLIHKFEEQMIDRIDRPLLQDEVVGTILAQGNRDELTQEEKTDLIAEDILRAISDRFMDVSKNVNDKLRSGQRIDKETHQALTRFHKGQLLQADRFESVVRLSKNIKNAIKGDILDDLESARLKLGNIIEQNGPSNG